MVLSKLAVLSEFAVLELAAAVVLELAAVRHVRAVCEVSDALAVTVAVAVGELVSPISGRSSSSTPSKHCSYAARMPCKAQHNPSLKHRNQEILG